MIEDLVAVDEAIRLEEIFVVLNIPSQKQSPLSYSSVYRIDQK